MTTSQLTRPNTTGPRPMILGGSGSDLLDFSAETADVAFNNNGANTGGFEAICGGSGNDTITNAGSLARRVHRGLGRQRCPHRGARGTILLDGGSGDDTLSGKWR